MIFELPLTEERVKPHQVAALHLFVALILVITASLLLAGYYAAIHLSPEKAIQYRWVLYYGQAISVVMYLVSLTLIIVVITRNRWLQKPTNNLIFRIAELLITIVIAIYSFMYGLTVPGIIFLVLAAAIIFAITWERKKDIPLIITVDKDGIRPPVTSRIRAIHWPDIEHVILRFGTLTINCTDNRLYQWNIGNTGFEPEVFEVYCIRQVDKAKEKRGKNDW